MGEPRGVLIQLLSPRGSIRRRWIDGLVGHRDALDVRRSAEWGPARLHVLMIVDRLPTPRHDGGSVRLGHILTALRRIGVHVTLVPAEASPLDTAYDIEEVPAQVLEPADLRSFLRIRGDDIDCCWFVRPETFGAFHRQLRRGCPTAQVVYDTVDLHTDRLWTQARASGALSDRMRARHISRLEQSAISMADQVLVVTPEEAGRARRWRPSGSILVVPNAHLLPPPPLAGFEVRRAITFVGGFAHHPNVDAAAWIVDELAPRISARCPGADIAIVGHGPPEDLVERAPTSVRFLGWVADLQALYAQTRVVIAPLRYGAGLKVKVGDAMAAGVPVVTTSVGAEGYGATPEVHLLVADDPEEFTESVGRVYEDKTVWDDLAKAGRDLIGSHFSPDSLERVLEDLVTRVKQTQSTPPGPRASAFGTKRVGGGPPS